MLTIDGSHGEGGGQILRSSLALSIVTQTPIRIENIRAGRAKPGLQRQHLTALLAAARVSNAKLTGGAIGSTQIEFIPGPASSGQYTFDVGTAGSTTLVFQTVLLPLLLARERSSLTLIGGTHNPLAPSFDFLKSAYLPLIARMGATIRATLERPGFYPAGGGRIDIDIEPVRKLAGFDMRSRGEFKSRFARVYLSRLPRHIAERELNTIHAGLGWSQEEMEIVEVANSPGPGNAVILEVKYENVTEVCTSIGSIGKPAEAVAMQAVEECRAYQTQEAPVGEHLTDQLMLPMALAGAGSFRSTGLSGHSRTHIDLIRRFLGRAAVRSEACPPAAATQSGSSSPEWLVAFGDAV